MEVGLGREKERRDQKERERLGRRRGRAAGAEPGWGGVAGSDGYSQATAVPRVTRLQWPP